MIKALTLRKIIGIVWLKVVTGGWIFFVVHGAVGHFHSPRLGSFGYFKIGKLIESIGLGIWAYGNAMG